MDHEVFSCSGCTKPKPRAEFHESRERPDRRRPVTSKCKDCRSDDYYRAKYPNTLCAQCLRPQKLDTNKICAGCNEESGLRECHGECKELLLLHLEFYKTRRVCRKCEKVKRRASKQRAQG